MGIKQYIVVFAAVILSIVVITAGPADVINLKSKKIVKVEKLKQSPVVKPFYSGKMKDRVWSVVRVPVAYVDHSRVGDCYREQPLLFGILSTIASIALAVLVFLLYMFRTDSRYR